MGRGLTQPLTASQCSQSAPPTTVPGPMPMLGCLPGSHGHGTRLPSLGAPVCRMQAVPTPHGPDITRAGLGSSDVLAGSPGNSNQGLSACLPLFYVFPVTKISKAKWALGPNHDAVSGELD